MFRALLLCFGLLAPFLIWAQDAEVVVTATKEPTDVQTVPSEVTVLGQDVLKNSLNIADALSKTLSVRLSTQSPGQPALTALGYGENGFGRVGFLLDGVTQNNPDMSPVPLNLVPLFAVDRIEILQGPGSAFYGNGTSGGVVNVVTKVPDRFQIEATTSVDQRWSNTQELSLGVPIGLGGLLLSTSHEQAFPERQSSDWDDWNVWSKYNLVISGTKDAPIQTVDAWVSFHNSTTQLPGGLSKSEYDADPNQAANLADNDVYSETRGGAQWSFQGDGWKLSTPVSVLYRQDKSAYNSYPAFSKVQTTTFNAEPRWSSDFEEILGGDLTLGSGLGGEIDRLDIESYPDQSFVSENYSAWVQRLSGSFWLNGVQNWNDRLYLSAAFRYESSRTNAGSPQKTSIYGEKWYFPLSGSLGLTWLPERNVKLGLEADQTFRYPFFDEMAYYRYSPFYFDTSLEAELGHSLIGSFDWDLKILKMKLGTTGTRMENEVWVNPTTGNNENSGPTYHVSGDFSLTYPWELSEETNGSTKIEGDLGVAYSLEKAWFASGAYQGDTVPLVPDGRYSFVASMNFWKRILADFQWNYTGPYYTDEDAANALPMVPFGQSLDLGVTWIITEGWTGGAGAGVPAISLRFWAKNLTDDRTPTFAYGTTGWYPTEGRTVGLLAKAEY